MITRPDSFDPPSANNKPQAEASKRSRGRPPKLDDVKRREICALVAGGGSTQEAARYVGCSHKTIQRETLRNAAFGEQLRRSEMYAQLNPLRAMQQAAATHWRAAAWMLERAYPDRFARRNPVAFTAQQARRLMSEVLHIVNSEVLDPFQQERIEKRLRVTFEYAIRAACDLRRSSNDLRRAIRFFEEKDKLDDPLAQFGFSSPNLATLFKPKAKPEAGPPTGKQTERPQRAPNSAPNKAPSAPTNP